MPKLIYKKQIYNGNITLNEIDDTTPSSNTTYSSQKINELTSGWQSIKPQILSIQQSGWSWFDTTYLDCQWKIELSGKTGYLICGAMGGTAFTMNSGVSHNIGVSSVLTKANQYIMIPCMVGTRISSTNKYTSGTLQIGGGAVNLFLTGGTIGTSYSVTAIYLPTFIFYL